GRTQVANRTRAVREPPLPDSAGRVLRRRSSGEAVEGPPVEVDLVGDLGQALLAGADVVIDLANLGPEALGLGPPAVPQEGFAGQLQLRAAEAKIVEARSLDRPLLLVFGDHVAQRVGSIQHGHPSPAAPSYGGAARQVKRRAGAISARGPRGLAAGR